MADRANREHIVEGQREIAGGDEQRSRGDLVRLGALDRLDHLVGIDVAEHVVKHVAGDPITATLIATPSLCKICLWRRNETALRMASSI